MSQATLQPRGPAARETPHYVDVDGEQVYCVVHDPVVPIHGRVLLLGPMPSERPYVYATWVDWARFLARRGLAVLHFDYRATGESTGAFADMDLNTWAADARAMVAELPGPSTPLTLCGLRLGALLGVRLFEEGIGDRLLAWAPPRTARDHLKELLRRRLAADMALDPSGPRKTRKDFMADLEKGGTVAVDGYPWSKRFWESAEAFPDGALTGKGVQVVHFTYSSRDQRVVDGGDWKIQIPRPPFWTETPWFRPDLGHLFEESANWIRPTGTRSVPS
jgi:pimeloyl-ACP methyl ester carboxylesterase